MACVSRHPHFAIEKFHYITLPLNILKKFLYVFTLYISSNVKCLTLVPSPPPPSLCLLLFFHAKVDFTLSVKSMVRQQ